MFKKSYYGKNSKKITEKLRHLCLSQEIMDEIFKNIKGFT
jgi:hypothetical protein